jgi:chromatin remodeling complex protein RSC6
MRNDNMIKFNATYFFEDNTPTIIKKELSPNIVIDTIRNFIANQYEYTFGEKPDSNILELQLDGFLLFNLHKNKYMLKSKKELLKYVNNKSVAIEEKDYFLNIFLYNQRPNFLSIREHEYLRTRGNLEGFNDYNNQSQTSLKSKFCTPSNISDDLAEFLGKERGTKMARSDISREINKYIRENNLQDKENKRIINPNNKLSTLLKLNDRDELTYFNLQRYISPHCNC